MKQKEYEDKLQNIVHGEVSEQERVDQDLNDLMWKAKECMLLRNDFNVKFRDPRKALQGILKEFLTKLEIDNKEYNND